MLALLEKNLLLYSYTFCFAQSLYLNGDFQKMTILDLGFINGLQPLEVDGFCVVFWIFEKNHKAMPLMKM